MYHAVLEEINLKEKLTIRRALTLCLILLKQCRASVADKTLFEICVALIQPALSSAEDEEIQMLAIESIGLLGLLDGMLFANYSTVFHAILEDSLRTIESQEKLQKSALHEAIVALKSSFDGLIVHGAI